MNKLEKIDVFAHVLLPQFYQKMLDIAPEIKVTYPFVNIESIHDMVARRNLWNQKTKQVISYANINPEDYCEPEIATKLCRQANQELVDCIQDNQDMFIYGIGMIPMNDIQGALALLDEISNSKELIGVQLFTRHLGLSVADERFRYIFEKCERLGLLILLHPVFDIRKPDNNIVFSWEYELSQAMLQLVNADIFTKYPKLKIIVHHAGAMIPYFSERIAHIMPEKKDEFKKFYVDTALLGNIKALELALSYFGEDRVLYGTDAPFGKMPSGATDEIEKAISALPVSREVKEKILSKNFLRLLDKTV